MRVTANCRLCGERLTKFAEGRVDHRDVVVWTCPKCGNFYQQTILWLADGRPYYTPLYILTEPEEGLS